MDEYRGVANALNRNIDDLFRYFLSELDIEMTKGGENQANFKAKITQSSLQKVLTKYINDYVSYPNCKSLKTIIRRDQSARFYILIISLKWWYFSISLFSSRTSLAIKIIESLSQKEREKV